MPVWEPLLIYALGTLWYGLFNWFWFWIWREQPLRESLSLLYRELADYCEAKYSLLTQHTDPEKRCHRCWCASKSGRFNYSVLSANAYAFRAKQYRLQADAAYFPGGAGFAGTYFGQFASAGRGAKLVERSHAEEVIRWNAQTVAARLRVLADDILYHRLPTRFTMEKQIGALEKSPASIRIIRLGNSATGISAASPACCAPKNRSMPVTYWPINSGECHYFRR